MKSEVLEILSKLNDPRLVAVFSYGHRDLYDELGMWDQESYDYDYSLRDHDALIDDVVSDWFNCDFGDLKISFVFNDGTLESMDR